MPGLNGCDVIANMRKIDRLTAIPVVVFTGSIVGRENLPPEKAYSRLIVKPFKLEHIFEAVSDLVINDDAIDLSRKHSEAAPLAFAVNH